MVKVPGEVIRIIQIIDHNNPPLLAALGSNHRLSHIIKQLYDEYKLSLLPKNFTNFW